MSGRRRVLTAVVVAALTALTGGCTAMGAGERSAQQQGYVAGDGSVQEITAAERGEPVVVSGTDTAGAAVSTADYAGSVVVLNLWYAACAPCRDEAPDLAAIAADTAGDAHFLGVNTRDTTDTAAAFERTFDLGYPSIVDSSGQAVLALRGVATPNAVPTTIVLDRQGRVAARISGRVEPSTLTALIRSAIDEPTAG